MPLNDSAGSPGRDRIVAELLDEMSVWRPEEMSRAIKHWLRGSLSLIHLQVLTVLEVDGPLAMSRLADALDVSVASATGIVDRMEDRGLVERRRESGDRRVVLVHTTGAGTDVFRELGVTRREHLAGLFSGMTDVELESLLVGMRAMHRQRSAGATPGAAR